MKSHKLTYIWKSYPKYGVSIVSNYVTELKIQGWAITLQSSISPACPINHLYDFVLCCYVVDVSSVLSRSVYPYHSGLLHWHWGNHMIAPVPVKLPWMIWVKHTSTKPQQSIKCGHDSWDYNAPYYCPPLIPRSGSTLLATDYCCPNQQFGEV